MWRHAALSLIVALGISASAQSPPQKMFGPVHQVENGMSPDAARRILGAPTAAVSFLGVEEWHYCAAAAPFRTVIFYFDAGHVIGKLDSDTRLDSPPEPCAGVFAVGGAGVYAAGGFYAWRIPEKVKELWAARAPIVILITAPSLPQAVALGSWSENGQFLSAVERPANVAPESLQGRPSYDVAMFWGYKRWGYPVSALKPQEADQHARFYPAAGQAPAILVFANEAGKWGAAARAAGLVRAIDQSGLDLLAKAGIPVR